MNDEALIRRLAAGNRTALNQAVDRFTPYVSAVAWRVLAPSSATREDLEEVVADVFLALWNHAGEIDPARARTWLGTVAKNRAVDRLRTLSPASPCARPTQTAPPAPRRRPCCGSGPPASWPPWRPWRSPTAPSFSATTMKMRNSKTWPGIWA